jgi:hypothetical protein
MQEQPDEPPADSWQTLTLHRAFACRRMIIIIRAWFAILHSCALASDTRGVPSEFHKGITIQSDLGFLAAHTD